MSENPCLAKGCPALCCRNNTIHFNAQEFTDLKRNVPKNYSFVEVNGQDFEAVRTENHDQDILYFNRYSPDIYSDDSRELIRLFVIACPFLANNQCGIFNKSYRPQACDSYEFNGQNCNARQLIFLK